MHGNKAVLGKIKSVRYGKFLSHVDYNVIEFEKYEVFVEDKSIGEYELKDLFSTKEELIASL